MILSKEMMKELMDLYGEAFYLLDSEQFVRNYEELKKAFSTIYPFFNIAYSYKTNYTPSLCRIVNKLGGYSEVVSDMEMELAIRIGVHPSKIIWNGPYKNTEKIEQLLLLGGTVNIDSIYEVSIINKIAQKYPASVLNVGIRCNFDIGDNVLSRFGFDIDSNDFKSALKLADLNNVHLINFQCHFAARTLDTWYSRVNRMLELLDTLSIIPERIDLGGGLFGKMQESLKSQFESYIPTFEEYAKVVATTFYNRFGNVDNPPVLLIEPGSALVGDCMKFASRVVNIKTIRGKTIATLLGSIYNINPTLNKKNPPIEIYSMGGEQAEYSDLDFGGFTCIETDYLYRNYKGKLAVGDMVLFSNVGSYSIVLKPPFILPNFPVLDICNGNIEVIKRMEVFDDLFHTFDFE